MSSFAPPSKRQRQGGANGEHAPKNGEFFPGKTAADIN